MSRAGTGVPAEVTEVFARAEKDREFQAALFANPRTVARSLELRGPSLAELVGAIEWSRLARESASDVEAILSAPVDSLSVEDAMSVVDQAALLRDRVLTDALFAVSSGPATRSRVETWANARLQALYHLASALGDGSRCDDLGKPIAAIRVLLEISDRTARP